MDKQPLRQAISAMLRRQGIAEVESIGAVKLQELMRQEGVKPEECVGSRGIIEMREE